MTDQTRTIRMVPLQELYLHPMNPRQHVPDEDVAAMAQSLASAGLLQTPRRWSVGPVNRLGQRLASCTTSCDKSFEKLGQQGHPSYLNMPAGSRS